MKPALALHGVSHTYTSRQGAFQALTEVSMLVPPRSSTAVMGRSGSGKSTLVSILSLMRRPSEGRLELSGVDTSTLNDTELAAMRNQHLGVVFQSFHLDPSATVLENVILPYYFQRELSRRSVTCSALDKLELVGMPEFAKRRPHEMSGGQRQRIAIARALVMNPAVLVADEPTGNLDEETAGLIAECVFALPEQVGATVIVVTHDSDIADLAQHHVHLQRGRVTVDPALTVGVEA
ncbi:ABC transporter ATP-binding protein [Micrococcales bacterium 31B]|nr:ABC transporter ATP-binding protein [Micrococcales bacterium 31B]